MSLCIEWPIANLMICSLGGRITNLMVYSSAVSVAVAVAVSVCVSASLSFSAQTHAACKWLLFIPSRAVHSIM